MKKTKRILIPFFILLTMAFAHEAYSQVDVEFGVKGGLNLANLSSDDNADSDNLGGIDDPSTRTGFHAGLTSDIQVADTFGIGVELLYSQQGTETDFMVGGVDAENEFKLDYVTLPVLAKVYLGDAFNLYGGVQPGLVVNAKQVNTVGEISTENDLKDDDGDFALVKDADFSIPIGLGYRTDNSFAFDARYTFGTTAVFEGAENESDSSAKNRVLQISIGYTF